MSWAAWGVAMILRPATVYLPTRAGDPRGRRILVLAGAGGNGGGVLVAARRLHTWGATVEIALGQNPAAMTPGPGHQLGILQGMGVPGSDRDAAVAALSEVCRTCWPGPTPRWW